MARAKSCRPRPSAHDVLGVAADERTCAVGALTNSGPVSPSEDAGPVSPSEDVVVADLNGAISLEGLAAYRARYAKVFADFPENKVVLLGRIAVGNVVIDHERVLRSPSAEPFEIAAIYTFHGDKIARVDFVKS